MKFTKQILYSLFQCSERTVVSAETNNTSEESSDLQLFAAGNFEDVALSRGHHVPLPPKAYFVEFFAAEGF